MSYCVHCGVELDASLKRCPLCNTIVFDPNNYPNPDAQSPYPVERGEVEAVKKKDIAIFLSVLLAATALTCGLLNLFVFSKNHWSLIVFGFCMLLWIFFIPFFIIPKISHYVAVGLDAVGVILFLYMISFLTKQDIWLYNLAIPITLLCLLLAICTMVLYRKWNHSYLASGLYFFADIGLLCMGIELLCRHYVDAPFKLTWSAVVFTVCAILIILIVTMFVRPRLRAAARKRLHF